MAKKINFIKLRKKFGLVQEDYLNDPWKVLVCCIFLNQTSHKQVRPMIKSFFKKFPTPDAVILAIDTDNKQMIRPIGFYNRRTTALKKFSKAYKSFNFNDDIKMLPGIGQYASDAYNILIRGNYSIKPNDGPLNRYVDWYHKNHKHLN